jgi:hypothetical protein
MIFGNAGIATTVGAQALAERQMNIQADAAVKVL